MAADKDPLDAFVDGMMGVIHKGVANGIAKGARAIQSRIGKGAAALEKMASCNCEPFVGRTKDESGVEESVLVHAKSCPARE